VAELGWAKDAENLYLDLQADPRKANELEAVDQILDAIEDDPDSAVVREVGLTAADGRRIWRVTNRYRNSDLMAVLWDIRDGQPIINWLGNADYGQ
jgi:hypothetical protein